MSWLERKKKKLKQTGKPRRRRSSRSKSAKRECKEKAFPSLIQTGEGSSLHLNLGWFVAWSYNLPIQKFVVSVIVITIISESMITQRKRGAAAKAFLFGTGAHGLLPRPRAHVFCANICAPNSHFNHMVTNKFEKLGQILLRFTCINFQKTPEKRTLKKSSKQILKALEIKFFYVRNRPKGAKFGAKRSKNLF